MELTDNLKLPVPGPDDTGAVALYLETLARKADAVLGQYQDELNQFVRPPVAVNVATTTPVISPDFEYNVQPEIFSAIGGGAVVYRNFPTDAGSAEFPVPGWWAIGAAKVSSSLTSGTDNNKPFVLILQVESTQMVPGQTTVLFRNTRLYMESTTNGEHGEIMGKCYIPPDAPDAYVRLRMWHSHTVTRTVQAGTVGWRVYLGSGDAAERAGL